MNVAEKEGKKCRKEAKHTQMKGRERSLLEHQDSPSWCILVPFFDFRQLLLTIYWKLA